MRTIAGGVGGPAPAHYPRVQLDAFVIMPNHVHGILVLNGEPGGLLQDPEPRGRVSNPPLRRLGLPEIVRAFKTFSARRVNEWCGTPGQSLWQRGYYDHVVRDDHDFDRVGQYIADNPARWADDSDNPHAARTQAT